MGDDGVGGGNLQAPTKAEQAENRLRAMEASGSEGLIGSAAQARATSEGHEIQREGQAKQERMGERQIASHEKLAAASNELQKISIGIQGGQLKLAQQRDAIDSSLKTIQYINAQTVLDLNEEFKTAEPERKKVIKDQLALLTGKDGDKWIPVPTGYDETTGKPTGYRMFNKADGTWEDPPKAGGGSNVQWKKETGEIRVNGEIIPGKKAKSQAEAAEIARNYQPKKATAPGGPEQLSGPVGDQPAAEPRPQPKPQPQPLGGLIQSPTDFEARRSEAIKKVTAEGAAQRIASLEAEIGTLTEQLRSGNTKSGGRDQRSSIEARQRKLQDELKSLQG